MSLTRLIYNIFQVYEALIVVWCVFSWIPRGGVPWLESLRDAIGTLVQPYLNLFRRFIPPFGGIDFSPIVAIFVLYGIRNVILYLI